MLEPSILNEVGTGSSLGSTKSRGRIWRLEAGGESGAMGVNGCQKQPFILLMLQKFWRENLLRLVVYPPWFTKFYIGVSKNNGTPKSSNLIGFSIINHPFWGTPIFGNIHIDTYTCTYCNYIIIQIHVDYYVMFSGMNEMIVPIKTLKVRAAPEAFSAKHQRQSKLSNSTRRSQEEILLDAVCFVDIHFRLVKHTSLC